EEPLELGEGAIGVRPAAGDGVHGPLIRSGAVGVRRAGVLDEELPAVLGADPGLLGRKRQPAPLPAGREAVPGGQGIPEWLFLERDRDRAGTRRFGEGLDVGL